jgi:hypothetical protein
MVFWYIYCFFSIILVLALLIHNNEKFSLFLVIKGDKELFFSFLYSLFYVYFFILLLYWRFYRFYIDFSIDLKPFSEFLKLKFTYSLFFLIPVIILIALIVFLVINKILKFFIDHLTISHNISLNLFRVYEKIILWILRKTHVYYLIFITYLRRKKYSNPNKYKRIRRFIIFLKFLPLLSYLVLVLIDFFVYFKIYLLYKIFPWIMLVNLFLKIVIFLNYEMLKTTAINGNPDF